jgi:hypothetical protein
MPAVAADAVADSGAPTRMTLETTIMVASPAFLIWAEPDERAKNCAIWGNPCGNYCSAVPLIVIYRCAVIIKGTAYHDRDKPSRIESIGLA